MLLNLTSRVRKTLNVLDLIKLLLGLLIGQVLRDSLRVGLHALLARPPPGRTHLAVLVGELEGLK